MTTPSIMFQRQGQIAILTLARPERHNALDAAMIAELTEHFTALASDNEARVVVIGGAGRSFCAGADLNYMRESLNWTHEENVADAERLSAMFEAAWMLPKPLIGRAQGAAIGGGAGLLACCDLVVASEEARFSFAEVKMGLVPAVIAQYVVPKIGVGHARALFVSGEQITPERAFEIGLVHAITSSEDLDATIGVLAHRMLSGAPEAIAAAKRMIDAVATSERDQARRFAIETIARARTSAEGQEGINAFLEKRQSSWSKRNY